MPNVEVINRFIGDDDLPAIFNRAHVVALPYVAASQSGVAYMAFAFERPVVATFVGGLPDVIRNGQNGFLVPPRSDAPLAEALERLADPATARRLVENIRRAKHQHRRRNPRPSPRSLPRLRRRQ